MGKSLEEFLKDISKGGKPKVICQNCGKVLQEGPDDNLSHGQCEPCSTKMLWQKGLNQEELTKHINKYGR